MFYVYCVAILIYVCQVIVGIEFDPYGLSDHVV